MELTPEMIEQLKS